MLKNNSKKFLLSIIIIFLIFAIDRFSKLYIINLAETENYVDIYLNSFLNFHLIWNTGIGFGLFSLEENLYYNLITILIVLINIIILIMVIKSQDYKILFLLMILGGSFGNLFDRVYYKAVPDFIDLHLGDYHWFTFNVADIFITVGIIGLILFELLKKEKVSENV